MDQEHREHFNELYHGTGEVIHELCDSNSKYQEGKCVISIVKTKNHPPNDITATKCHRKNTKASMYQSPILLCL